MISSPWIWKGVSATFKDTPSHIKWDDFCLFQFRVLITIVKRWIAAVNAPDCRKEFNPKDDLIPQVNPKSGCRNGITVNLVSEMVVSLTLLWRWFKVNTCQD